MYKVNNEFLFACLSYFVSFWRIPIGNLVGVK